VAELTVRIDGVVPGGSSLPVAQSAPAKSSAPVVTNVLAASAAGDQTLFSLTSGQIWYGFVALTATLTGANKTATITINNLGGSATPNAGTDIAGLTLKTTTATDAIAGETHTPYFYIYAGGSDNDLHVAVSGDPSTVLATAYGYLLS